MAYNISEVYAQARAAFARGDIKWLDDDIRAVIVTGFLHSPAPATHEFRRAAITEDAELAVSELFTNKVVTANGAVDADDVIFVAPDSPRVGDYLIIFQDTGDPTTDRLIALFTTQDGLHVVLDGHDIEFKWDTGVNKIFTL